MAYITINRAKRGMIFNLKENLKYVALYKNSYSIEVGTTWDRWRTEGKSDGSAFFAEPILDATDVYRTSNSLTAPKYIDGKLTDLNKTLNFMLQGGQPSNKLVFWGDANNIVRAVITLATPYSSPVDTSIYISKIEISVG